MECKKLLKIECTLYKSNFVLYMKVLFQYFLVEAILTFVLHSDKMLKFVNYMKKNEYLFSNAYVAKKVKLL